MITLITALYPEAKSLIHTLNLKQNTTEHLYSLYEGDGYRLCITGSGMISAATCATRHFTLFPPKSSDLVINLGIAGYVSGKQPTLSADALQGRLYLTAKLSEQSTGRTFYPDLLYRNNFDLLPVTTVPAPVTDASLFSAETLVDMEASALYQALLPFFTPERMMFFKVVSDVPGSNQSPAGITPALTEQLIRPHIDSVLSYAKKIEQHLSSFPALSFTAEENQLKEELYKKLPLTESTQKEVIRLLRYVKLTGTALVPILESFLASFPETPVRGKKQAAPYVKLLHDLVLSHAPLCSPPASSSDAYAPFYAAAYVEEALLSDDTFLSEYPLDAYIPIAHYKDVFNRSHQNFAEQKRAPALIYAKKTGTLIYEGAPVCQSFGNEHFYYTSCIMNCIYHCDYCYLQGMYPSGHTVVFVNIDDYFAEVERLLQKHPVYLCISYDTDLLALEQRFHFVAKWLEFSKLHPDLTLEIRTKSGNPGIFKELAALYGRAVTGSPAEDAKRRIIFAWTVSPEGVAACTEHGAPSLVLRLQALLAAKQAGFSVRLCFDPMIYHTGWRESYKSIVKSTFNVVSGADLYDVSIGVFRISAEYLKNMRKKRPDSAIVQFPYITENGVSHYGTLSEEMIHYLRDLLLDYVPEDKIFVWEGEIS